MTNSPILELAVQYHRSHRFTEAEQAYRQVLKEQPQQVEALYGLGMLAQELGEPQTAELWLSAVLQVQPDSVKTWFSLGNLRLGQEQYSEAAIAYRQALTIRPDSLPIYNNLGYALQQQGRFDEAIDYYQQALALKPDFIEAEANLGNALHAQGKLSSEQQLHYAKLNHKLGVARKKAGDLKTAEAYYRQAIALKPDLLEAYDNLGNLLQEQGELDEAITCYQTVLQLNPNYAEVYFNLGKLYQQKQQLLDAAAAYRQWLKLINPHYAKAVETYQNLETTQAPLVTPPIPQTEVTVGKYQFPAIPPVTDGEKRPFWTVVVTVYNRTDYLFECLTSVLAQWPGSEEMEILVMDNASDLPVFEIVNSIGKAVVRYYRNPENIGVIKNMNAGIALSRGQWVHILHDDDCVRSGFYAQLKQSLEACPDSVGAAFTAFEYINENSEVLSCQKCGYGEENGIPQDWLWRIGIICIVMLPAVVIRRATFERLGGYHPEITEIADWEMNKRIAAVYDWWFEAAVLARYRVHNQRESNQYARSYWKQAIALRRAIEMSESYFPAEHSAAIAANARNHYFNVCLTNAKIALNNREVDGAFRIIQEALKLDESPPAVANLFAWLTQDEAAPLRDKIAAQLVSISLSDQIK